MDENKKNLKITSYIIIILAIFNVVLFGIGFAKGELKDNIDKQVEESISQNKELEDMKDKLTDITLYGTIGATAIGVLFDLYLGIAGLRQASGKSKGKVNIVLATIVFVFALIGLIPMIMQITKDQTTISSLVSSLAGLIIMFYYIRYAKKAIEE